MRGNSTPAAIPATSPSAPTAGYTDNSSATDVSAASGFNGEDNLASGTNILVYISKDGTKKAEVKNAGDSAAISGAEVKVSSNAGAVDVELKIPRAALGTISNGEIKIYANGSIGGTYSGVDGYLGGVIFPEEPAS